jgi:hypothetical protein
VKEISQNSVDRALEGALERLILFVASGKDTTGAYDKARQMLVDWALTHAESLERPFQDILKEQDEMSSPEYKLRLYLAQLMFRVPAIETLEFVSSFLVGVGKYGELQKEDVDALKLIRDRAINRPVKEKPCHESQTNN